MVPKLVFGLTYGLLWRDFGFRSGLYESGSLGRGLAGEAGGLGGVFWVAIDSDGGIDRNSERDCEIPLARARRIKTPRNFPSGG